MKDIFILHNKRLPVEFAPSKMCNSEKYSLHLISDPEGIFKLNADEKLCFKTITVIETFSYSILKNLIERLRRNITTSLEIIPATEESVSICGKLRIAYGLETKDFERFTNKIEMKHILENSSIQPPKHIFFDKNNYFSQPTEYIKFICHTLSFPMFFKPINQASCIGTAKVNTLSELEILCKNSYVSEFEFEIDEFIDGELFHCDSYIKDEKIIHTQISKCSRPCFDFMQGKTKGSIVLPNDDEDFLNLHAYTERTLSTLKAPKNGVTHLEIFKTKKGKFLFLEIAHRSPGILIPEAYKIYSGIDTREAHILLYADKSYKITPKNGPYAAWAVFPMKEGVIKKLNHPILHSPHKLNWYYQEGEKLFSPKRGRDYVGAILLWNENYSQLEKDFRYINNFIPYSVAPLTSSQHGVCPL